MKRILTCLALVATLFVGCDSGDLKVLETVKNSPSDGGYSFAQLLSAYSGSHSSVSWKVDHAYRSDNNDLSKVVAAVPIALGSHSITVQFDILWNKDSQSVFSVERHVGVLTDYGKGAVALIAADPQQKQVASSCLTWLMLLPISLQVSPEELKTDEGVRSLVARWNQNKTEGEEVLLPW
jgi:hypothetical protein